MLTAENFGDVAGGVSQKATCGCDNDRVASGELTFHPLRCFD